MDNGLLALQKELEIIQKSDIKCSLYDHNIIDLIVKLEELNKINLIYTLDRKILITPEKLQNMIENELIIHGGRIRINDLQQNLNINMFDIEEQINNIMNKVSKLNKYTFMTINEKTELMNILYINDLIESLNEQLQEKSQIEIVEIATKYDMNIELVKDIIETTLESKLLKAKKKGNKLFTDLYIKRQNAIIRGIFSAITTPIHLKNIYENYGLDEEMVKNILKELIQSQHIHGFIKNEIEYIPFIFFKKQKDALFTFFKLNNYLEKSRAYSLQVVRPYEFLNKGFMNQLIELPNFIIHKKLIDQIVASLEVTVSDETWINIHYLLPVTISSHKEDCAMILQESVHLIDKKQSKIRYAFDTYGVTIAFLNKCFLLLEKQSDNYLEIFFNKNPMNSHNKRNIDIQFEKYAQKECKKNYKNSKKGHEEVDSKSLVDDSTASLEPTIDYCKEIIYQEFNTIDEELLTFVVKEVYPATCRYYVEKIEKRLHSIQRGDALEKVKLQQKVEKLFHNYYFAIIYAQRSIQIVENFVLKDIGINNTVKNVENSILNNLGIGLLNFITIFICHISMYSHELSSSSLGIRTKPIAEKILDDSELFTVCYTGDKNLYDKNLKDKNIFIQSLNDLEKNILEKSLGSQDASIIIKLWNLSNVSDKKASLNDLLYIIDTSIFTFLNIPKTRKQDRKNERQGLFLIRQEIWTKIKKEDTDNAFELLKLVIQSLFQQYHSIPLYLGDDVEAKTLLGILSVIHDNLTEDVAIELKNICMKIIELDKSDNSDLMKIEMEYLRRFGAKDNSSK